MPRSAWFPTLPRLEELAIPRPPDTVEAILDGRQPEGTRLEDLLEGFCWSRTGRANSWRSMI